MEFNLKQAYRLSFIINAALIAGVVLFFFVVMMLLDFKLPEFKSGLETMNVVSVLSFGLIPIGVRVSNAMANKITKEQGIQQRYAIFQTAMLVRWACIEVASMFAVVGLLLSEDSKQIIIFLLCIMMFFTYFLNKDKAAIALKMDRDEARKFKAESL